MRTPTTPGKARVHLGPARIAADTVPPELAIIPAHAPVDFGWNQDFEAPSGGGADFYVTFINGDTPLPAGTLVYVRANFWMVDPQLLAVLNARGSRQDADSDGDPGSGPSRAFTGLQDDSPRRANYVELAPGGAEGLEMRPPQLVNAQRRIVPVAVGEGGLVARARFTLHFRNVCSVAVRNHQLGMCTDANEPAFVAVVEYPEHTGIARLVVKKETGGRLVPGPAALVHAVGPTRAQAGVAFPLRLAVLDDMDNLVEDFAGAVRLACETDTGPDFGGGKSVVVDVAGGAATVSVTLAAEGVHRVTAAFEDPPAGALAPAFHTAPVVVTAPAPARQVLWGDYHGHSWHDDGTGEVEVLLDYARRAAALDWYVLTPHDAPPWPFIGAVDIPGIAGLVEGAQEDAGDGTAPFVTLPAFEWTHQIIPGESRWTGEGHGKRGGGHHIVLARDWGILLDEGIPAWMGTGNFTPRQLLREMIRRQEARRTHADPGSADFMMVPHDLLCCNWWDLNAAADREPEITPAEQARYCPLAQVYSMLHGNHESPQEDGTWDDEVVEGCEPWRHHSESFGVPAEPAGLVNGLKYGVRYGVVAGGDSHSGRPGSFVFGALTAVLAREHTRDGVFDALRARHTYATSGHRLLMEFSCGDAIMGDEVEFDPASGFVPELAFRVVSPTPIRLLRIVRVRAFLEGEDPADPNVWQYVKYVYVHEEEGPGRTEIAGVFRDDGEDGKDGFRADEWPYASYFLVVSHENTRPHATDRADDPDSDHHQDRGWTSPIFFRRHEAAEGPARSAG